MNRGGNIVEFVGNLVFKRIRLKQLTDGLFRKCSGRLFQQSTVDGIKEFSYKAVRRAVVLKSFLFLKL